MKNLFLVINKEKIYAYVVSIMTIVVIFFMSSMLNSDIDDTETTASNSIENVQSNENKQNIPIVETNAQVSENIVEENDVETNGEIGEAISTSTPSADVNNAVENN